MRLCESAGILPGGPLIATLPFRWVAVKEVGGTTVVRFTHRGALVGDAVELVAEQLCWLVDEGDRQHLVLDLGDVQTLASAMIGRFVLLQKKLLAAGSRLKVCQVNPELGEVLKLVGFDQLVGVYGDEKEALGGF
jgi:anti-anti-sigma factor